MAASKQVPRANLTGHTRAPPPGTKLTLAMCDVGDIPAPAHPYLQRLNDPPVASAQVKCWHVNQDPEHVGLASPFDLAVLGAAEVYWGAPRASPRPFEQSFLLGAIRQLEVSRPAELESVLPADAVAVLLHTPSGQTLMLCPLSFADQLRAAIDRAGTQRKKRR